MCIQQMFPFDKLHNDQFHLTAIQSVYVVCDLEIDISVQQKYSPVKISLITSYNVITDLLWKRAPQSHEKPQLAK